MWMAGSAQDKFAGIVGARQIGREDSIPTNVAEKSAAPLGLVKSLFC